MGSLVVKFALFQLLTVLTGICYQYLYICMDILEEKLRTTKFFKNHNPRAGKYKEAEGDEFLYFGSYVERRWGYGLLPCRGSKEYPDIEKLLHDIALERFHDFKYNRVQINKNVKTPRHRDANNSGDSYIFTVGDFTGGNLGTDDGSIDIYHKPLKFDGSLNWHWTEPFEGDRYCVIYYYNPQEEKTTKKNGSILQNGSIC